MKIFGFNIERQKARTSITVNEETLYRMLFETMAPFIKLKRDSKLEDVISEGYESSPNVFSVTNKVITMFSQIPYKVFKGEKEIETGPIEKLFEASNTDYTFREFRQNWHAMGMITGETISYYLTRSGGGDLMHLQIAPSQNVEIEFGDFENPIKGYTLDLSSREKLIPPDNIWHVRFFPNLNYQEGQNYRGLSPIRVASRIINSEVFGADIIQSSYKRGMPPGILTKRDETFNLTAVEEQRKQIESSWDRKYGNRSRAGKPIFTVGDVDWIPIGFTSFNDLQIAQINLITLRTICNMWGIPSRVMNDMESGSYTKDKEDRKAIYTNRLIPDNDLFWSGINRLIKSTGIRYEPDYSQIPELQEDKLEMAKILKIGWDANSVKVNEFRAQLQLEEDPAMEGMYRSDIDINPVNQIELPPDKL